MTAVRPSDQNSRHLAAFVAAGFFYLAGTICVVLSLFPRNGVFLTVGTISIFVGSIWVVIGAKFKKES
jgi:uncharacterized membrane protein